jgi:hypothetical protein
MLMPAVWVIAIVFASVAVLVAGSGHLRSHKVSAAQPVVNPLAPVRNAAQRSQVRASLDALPLAFEANQGQTDARVKYLARGNGYTVFLTGNDTVFALNASHAGSAAGKYSTAPTRREAETATAAAIHMKLVGANQQAQIVAGKQLPGRTNYFIGNNPSKWQRDVKQYATVSYREVYPGVNLAFHGQQRQVEFDFIVAPEASVTPIRFDVTGTKRISTDAAGNLVLSSAAGDVLLHKPVAYQEKDNTRQPVDARFAVEANNTVRFELGNYDRSQELVIDPSLSYATYLGGASEDEVFGIAVDPSGNVYATGESDSTAMFPGGNVPSADGFDAFVTKLTPSGALSYTTFVGGTSTDSGLAIAVDSNGAAYITGVTESADFPVTTGAAQTTQTGLGTNCTNKKVTGAACSDAFAVKLSSTGSSVWATFIGGQNDDHGYAIALDGNGNVWVAGDTFSSSFYPVQHATTVLTSSFNNGVAQSPPSDDGFVVEISPNGSAPFLYATYLGGSAGDQINGIAIDGSNNVYVAGETASTDFPVTSGAYQTTCGSDGNCNAHLGSVYYDAFVTKLVNGKYSNTGGYSTYIGGSSDDYAFAIAVDGSGDAYITGQTSMDDTTTTPAVPYPTTNGAFSTTYNASATANGFVTELNPAGSALVYSTFLGGSTQDFGGGIAVDQSKNAYVSGTTLSTDFPTTSNATQTKLNGNGTTGHSDAFVTEVLAGGATLGFSSYLGGSGDENANASGSVGTVAVDSSNNVWVGGSTDSSSDFPVTSNAAEGTYGGNPYDGFVAQIANYSMAATAPASVAPGSSGSSTVTLSSIFGNSPQVTLSCAVTGSGSPLPSCSSSNAFSTNPVTPTSAGATSTLTITTTGAAAAMSRSAGFIYAMWLPVVGFALIGMRFSTAGTRKRKVLGFFLLGIVMTMLFFLPACGGSSNNGGGGGGCSGCTPAGNYTVTITGTQGSLTQTTQVTLTVN